MRILEYYSNATMFLDSNYLTFSLEGYPFNGILPATMTVSVDID